MTREEYLKFEIQEQKEVRSFIYKTECKYQDWRYDVEKKIADLEKQLAELEVKVYEPMYLEKIPSQAIFTDNQLDKNIKIDRHNAGEELKKIISEENAKQGWKVDWKDEKQLKYCIEYYDNKTKLMSIDCYFSMQMCENELYFSEQSSKDQDFLDKIKPLWLRWKGITE